MKDQESDIAKDPTGYDRAGLTIRITEAIEGVANPRRKLNMGEGLG